MTGEPCTNDNNKCTICGNYYRDLKRYLVVHTGETPYACRLCRTGFGQKSNLVRHLMSVMHKDVISSSSGTERAVFNCCFCKLMFETSKELRKHITYNHENLLVHTGERMMHTYQEIVPARCVCWLWMWQRRSDGDGFGLTAAATRNRTLLIVFPLWYDY